MTQDTKYMLESIYHNSQEMLARQDLANDTIRIALNIMGYEVGKMNQFERASALLDMAMEYKAMADTRDAERIDIMWQRIVEGGEESWQYDNKGDTMRE